MECFYYDIFLLRDSFLWISICGQLRELFLIYFHLLANNWACLVHEIQKFTFTSFQNYLSTAIIFLQLCTDHVARDYKDRPYITLLDNSHPDLHLRELWGCFEWRLVWIWSFVTTFIHRCSDEWSGRGRAHRGSGEHRHPSGHQGSVELRRLH